MIKGCPVTNRGRHSTECARGSTPLRGTPSTTEMETMTNCNSIPTDTAAPVVVADRVRSFDFCYHLDTSGPNACFVDGVVIAIPESGQNAGRYQILVTRQVFAGEERSGPQSLVGEYVYPPLNGREGIFGTLCGVVRIVPTEEG